MKPLYLIINLIAIFQINATYAFWTDMEVESVTTMNDTMDAIINYHLDMKRMSKTVFALNGEVIVNVDSLRPYEAGIIVYYSAKGNNQYVQSPVNIPRKPLCDLLNNEFRKFVLDDLANCSDIPHDEGDMCDLFEKKSYIIKNYELQKKSIPKFLQTGLYKVHVMAWQEGNDVIVGGLVAMIRLL